jgi:hypothetical protein
MAIKYIKLFLIYFAAILNCPSDGRERMTLEEIPKILSGFFVNGKKILWQ